MSSEFRRLHPMTLPLRGAAWARTLLVPVVLVLLFARGSSWQMWAMMFIIPASIYEVFRYLTMRYSLGEHDIVVRVGLVFRNERHIPYGRIQNIDLVQGPLARILGVAEARLETASGSEPEAVFRYLSLGAIERMRRAVFAGRVTPPTAEAEPESLLRLSTGELVKLGIISNRGMAVVAIVMGLMWEFDLFDSLRWEWAQSWFERTGAGGLVLQGVAIVFAVLVLLMLFSVLWTIVRFHDFTLRRQANDLRLSFGLLTRHAATVPRRRVQFVSIHETVPHRWFDRVSMRIETAGGSGSDDEGDKTALSRRWFAPLLPKMRARALLEEVNTGFRLDDASWRPLAPKARARMTKKMILVSMIPTAIFLAMFYPWGVLSALVLVPAAIWYAAAAVRRMAWARLPEGIAFRSGVWTRKVSATLADRLQVVAVSQTPFDRRHRMASLTVDTAGAGPAGHRISIPYVEEPVARELQADLADAAQRSVFKW